MRDDDSEQDLLRARLSSIDPARALPAASPDQVAQLSRRAREAPPARPSRSPGSRAGAWRRRRVLLPAGGLALAAGAVVAVGVLSPSAGPTVLTSPPGAGGLAAICAPVDVAGLRQADTAFRATVTSLADTTASMRVDTTFRGSVARTVQVDYRPDEQSETSMGTLVVGQQVLVAALDDTVLACGRSGTDSPELATLYQEAFR